MLLRFVIVKNCYLYFLVVLYFLVDSFFFIPRVPIYIPIYIVYIKFLLSLVTLICSYDLYYISLSMSQCPSFKKKMSLPFISFRHLVKVMSFVIFWDGCEGGRILSLEFGRRGLLVFLVFQVFVTLLRVKGLQVIVFGVLLHALPFFLL